MKIVLSASPSPRSAAAALTLAAAVTQVALSHQAIGSLVIMMGGIAYGHLTADGPRTPTV